MAPNVSAILERCDALLEKLSALVGDVAAGDVASSAFLDSSVGSHRETMDAIGKMARDGFIRGALSPSPPKAASAMPAKLLKQET